MHVRSLALTLAVLVAVSAGTPPAPVAAAPARPGGVAVRPPAASSFVPLPILRFSVPKAAVKYFPIEGTTYTDLIASIRSSGSGPCAAVEPEYSSSDLFVAGCFAPSLKARTLTRKQCVGTSCTSTCTVTTVTGTSTVFLPQWVAPDQVPSALLAWWRVVAADVRRHEARHVTIFNQWLAKLRKEAVGRSCASWPSIYAKWQAREEGAQAAFDAAERGRQWPEPPREDY